MKSKEGVDNIPQIINARNEEDESKIIGINILNQITDRLKKSGIIDIFLVDKLLNQAKDIEKCTEFANKTSDSRKQWLRILGERTNDTI